MPRDAPASTHLASRLAVERVLLDALPGSTALRASIVIGAGSRSFRFLVRLIERLPLVALPAWRDAPHAADRRARRDRVARPRRDRARRRPAARSTSPARTSSATASWSSGIRDLLLLRRPLVAPRTRGARGRPSSAQVDERRRGGDRRRAARARRPADGGADERPAAARRLRRRSCSACGCTHSTRRSSTRSASGSAASRSPHGDVARASRLRSASLASSGVRTGAAGRVPSMTRVHCAIEIAAPPERVWEVVMDPQPPRRLGDDPSPPG